jgi:hypothetical protein
MAQIQISIDTETKSLSLTIDGTTIPDVEDVSVYTYRDSNGNITSLDVSMYTTTEEQNGIRKRVSYHAYASEKAQSAIASGQKVYKDVKGFVGIEDGTQAAKDIDDFLSSQKRPN